MSTQITHSRIGNGPAPRSGVTRRSAARRALFLTFWVAQRELETQVARARPLNRTIRPAQAATRVGNEVLDRAAYGHGFRHAELVHYARHACALRNGGQHVTMA